MDLSPSFDTFARAWRAGKNQTVWTNMVSDLETPVSAMFKLRQGKSYCFLLESVEGGAVRGRYSIIGREPDLVWRCEQGGKVSMNRHVQTSNGTFIPQNGAPLDELRALLDECHIDEPNQPQPMAAGLFGYLGYEIVRYMERLPEVKPNGIDVPEAILFRPTLLAIFDQIENKFTLVTPAWFDKSQTAETAYAAAQGRLERAVADLNQSMPAHHPGECRDPAAHAHAAHDKSLPPPRPDLDPSF